MSTPNKKLKQLGKSLGVPKKELLAMSPNHDPFNSGTPLHRARAEWFRELWEGHGPTHLRDLHYIVSQQVRTEYPTASGSSPYLNDDPSWEALLQAALHARCQRFVDPLDFVDRRNTNVHHFAPERSFHGHLSPQLWVPSIHVDLPERPDLDMQLPRPCVDGYEYWEDDQPYRLEIWAEKELDELVDVCERLSVELWIGAGHQSMTRIANLCYEVYKPTRVLMVSDFDASGETMPVHVARNVEFFREHINPDAEIAVDWLALTADQVLEYDLPPIPHKGSDSGALSFQERRGIDGRVELNALTALHPGVLTAIVEDRASGYRDSSWEHRLREAENDVRHGLHAAWEVNTEEEQEELEGIKADFVEAYTRYETEIEDMDIHSRIDGVNDSLSRKARIEVLGLDLPARPEADLNEPDESEWLFHSDRDFLEQLQHYRRHREGPPDD